MTLGNAAAGRAGLIQGLRAGMAGAGQLFAIGQLIRIAGYCRIGMVLDN